MILNLNIFAFGNYEEAIDVASGISTKDYYIYGGDGVAAIYRISGVGSNTTSTMYYIHKDNLGSFDKVTNSSGAVVDSYSFDAWGNRRSTSDWTAAETNTNHLFSRGFTGHEHLDEFGLINMNGRCYDPLLGRVLSPDPELQDPSNIQNYNRYSYCLNNPLKYTDPSGYYIYGKTYQVDPVYSIPHFSDLDLPGGCRYDIAEYLDERQNRVEMEQMELNSRFGLVGGLGGGGGGGGFDNYLPSIMCEDGRRSYADPADETSGNESNTIMFPQCFETYDGFNTCLYNVLSGISDKWDLYKSTGFFIDQNCLFSGTNDTENGFTSYNDNVICHLEFINSIEGFNAKQISYGDVAGNLIAGNSVIVVTNGYDPTKTMYHAMEVAGMQFNPEDTLLWCRDPNKSYNNEDPLRWFSANALNDNNNCTFYISVWR